MQSGSTAGFSRLQLYLYSGRRNLPSPVGWSQKDGAGGVGGFRLQGKNSLSSAGSSCSKVLMAAGLGKGRRRQVCSASARGRALPAREKSKKKTREKKTSWLHMAEQRLQGEGGCRSDSPRLAGSLYTLSLQSPYI